jgi:outer membrane protein
MEYRLESAQYSTKETERSLSEQVVRAYLQVWSLMESMQTSKEALAVSRQVLSKDSVLFNAGSLTGSDLALAAAQVASDSLSFLTAQNSLVEAWTTLRQLLELPMDAQISLASPDTVGRGQPLYAPAEIQSALEHSPAVRRDSLGVLAAHEQIEVAKAGRWPSLSLSAGLNTGYDWNEDKYGPQLRDNLGWSASLSLGIPIIDWGATDASILSAQISKENAQISLQNTAKQLQNTVETLVLQTEAARMQWQVADIQVEAQKSSLQIATAQAALGAIDNTALIQQQNLFNNAVSKQNQAKYNYLLGKSLLELWTK